jgi:aspartate/methionine/tyrosine aminotransferase
MRRAILSGTVYEPAELQALAAVVAAHPRLMVISDEVYEYFAYEGSRRPSRP